MKKWICPLCGYEMESETKPPVCPVCGYDGMVEESEHAEKKKK
jgi:rubrerythrin